MNVREIVDNIRKENMCKIIERVKYDAYADECSTYSAIKNNMYNISVKEMI